MPLRPRLAIVLLLGPLLGQLLAACPAAALEESRSIREVKRFTGPGPHVVEIDNYRGPITVTAGRGDAVEATIGETVTGRTQGEIAEAKEKVKLEVTQEGNRVRFYVDGPFRCRDGHHGHGGWSFHEDEERIGERVTYAFEVRVPAGTELEVRTVNGDVRVDGADARFAVGSVNGGVAMAGVRGAGSARSVNGPVRVTFAANPAAASRFETVNGEIDVAFRQGLGADMRFKTLNGEVFTDFPYQSRSLATPSGDRRKGRFVLQRGGAFGVTIGGGGPEHAFATINGNILVRNQDQ